MDAGCISPVKSRAKTAVINKAVKVELPDNLLTAGDLVGRAVRICRANWLSLGRFFFLPTFFYWLAIPCAFWDPETYTSDFSASTNFWIISAGCVLIFFSIWEISVRKFALIYYLAGLADSIQEGLKAAQKKMWLILVLSIPVIIFEVFENFLSILAAKVGHISEHAADSYALVYWEMFLSGLELSLLMPFLWVIILNAYFMAYVIFENASIAKACSRFLSLSFQDSIYITITLTLMSVVYFCVGGPVIGLLAFESSLPKEAFWYFASGLGAAVFASPLDGFMSAVITVGGALLYKQVCARREGKDLLEKLNVLEGKQLS